MPSVLRKKPPRTTITAAITTMAAAITVATTAATTAAAMAAQTLAASSSRFPQAAASSLHPPFGYRYPPIYGGYCFHNGVDLAVAQGTPVYATKSGTVTTATFSSGYGYYVTINHGDGFSSLYGHMTHYTVSSGDYVNQGDLIGYVGSTGYSTGPHLHFTMFYNGATVNPMDYVSIR